MSTERTEIDALLRDTYEDRRLARSEKRSLKAVADEAPEARLRLRRRAFELAREFAAQGDVGTVIDWLEDVEKALFEVDQGPIASEEPEAWFSPRQDVCQRLVHAIEKLRSSADIAVFTITDNRVSKALIAAHGKGVKLRVLTDNDKANDLGSDIEHLAKAGIEVRLDRSQAHMHHKFAIFDANLLINGSYNWTRSASTENQENLVLNPSPVLVAAFSKEFEIGWAKAEPW